MMAEKVYQSFLETSKYWLKELDYYGKNQFKTKVVESGWTIGQIYHHLLEYTREYHFSAIEQCIQNRGVVTEKGKTFHGWLVFKSKAYLPIKYKSKPTLEPQQPIATEKVKDDFYRFLKVMYRLAKEIERTQPVSKVQHPVFGFLTANEWYFLIYLHFKHHLKQKHKLDRVVRSNYKETVLDELDDIPDMPMYSDPIE